MNNNMEIKLKKALDLTERFIFGYGDQKSLQRDYKNYKNKYGEHPDYTIRSVAIDRLKNMNNEEEKETVQPKSDKNIIFNFPLGTVVKENIVKNKELYGHVIGLDENNFCEIILEVKWCNGKTTLIHPANVITE